MLSDERSRSDFSKFVLGDPDEMIAQRKDFGFHPESIFKLQGQDVEARGCGGVSLGVRGQAGKCSCQRCFDQGCHPIKSSS